MRHPRVALVLFAVLAGCDQPYADDPAIDPEAPVVRIDTPARGQALGNVTSVVVAGQVIDDSPLRELRVAGAVVPLGPDGTFQTTVALPAAGTELITVEATDRDGNVGRQTRAVSAGPSAPLAQRIPDAVTAALSDDALAAVGQGVAATIATSDLGAWIAPHNPVISKGAPDGPDCLYGAVSVGALDVASATIELWPTALGLELRAELTGVRVPMHLDYAALCIDGSSDALATATGVTISGRMTLGIRDGRFELALASPQIRFVGMDLSLTGVPGQVVSLLDLGSTLGPVLAWAVERLAAPALGDALAGVDGTGTVELLGKTLDLAFSPTRFALSPVDAELRLDSSMRTRGEPAAATFVMVPNTPIPLGPGAGMRLAVSDDAVNQLLASFWAAGGMDHTFDLTTGDYAGLGKLFDRVRFHSRLPLSVRADDGAGPRVVVPELVVSFLDGDAVATELALNGALTLGIERTGDGALRLVSSAPQIDVDLVTDGVTGNNPLAKSQLEVLASFAAERLTAVAAGLVGSVPLPSGPGEKITEARVTGRGGTIVIDVAVTP